MAVLLSAEIRRKAPSIKDETITENSNEEPERKNE
jgi:hypothetical protein